MGKQWKQCQTLFFRALKSPQMVTAAMKLKDACSLEGKLYQPREHIKKQRHYFVNKDPSSLGYGFSSGHIWMWELDCEESWVPKYWCFWTGCWRRLLKVPWTARRSNQSILGGDQSWVHFGRTDAKAETPVLWPLHAKSGLIGKDSDAGRDWGQEEKGMTEDEMPGWHHRLDGGESEWTPGGVGQGDGQGGLACCNSWGCKKLDTTERLNWTEGTASSCKLLI